MSYYLIQPRESYGILRNCPKCKGKSRYKNTDSFRVNANGKQIDVWLIYQCEACKNTYNLTIYERVRASALPAGEYEAFLRNDKDTAFYYGRKKSIFTNNKAEINFEDIPYEIIPLKNYGQEKEGTETGEGENLDFTPEGLGSYGESACQREEIIIQNPYGLRIRVDRVMAEIMQISRSAVKELFQKGILSCAQNYAGEYNIVTRRKEDASDNRN